MILSDNLKGAGFMAAAMAGFAFNDALMKSLAGEVPLFQAIFVRGVFATLLVGALALRVGAVSARAFAPADRGRLALRILAELSTTACFLTALFNMRIADATAILQFTPLAITLAAAIVLGERTSLRRWLAVGAGLIGVLMILRPGANGVEPAALWALGAVVSVVVRDLVTRGLSPATSSLSITLLTAVSITLLGGVVTGLGEWRPLSALSVATMAAAALFLFVGYYCSTAAMRVGEIGVVSPFRYSILIWAMVLGLVIFDERPDALTIAGAALVVGAGLSNFFVGRRRA